MVLYLIKKFNIVILFVIVTLLSSCVKDITTESNIGDSHLYQGEIYVNSDPQGSKIYLDGKYSGYLTPDTVKGVSYGEHKLLLIKDIFPDTILNIAVQENAVNNCFVNYYTSHRNYGNIICASVPTYAAIYLNGTNIHQITPYEINNLFAGNYNISYSFVGHRTANYSVTVRGSVTCTVYLTLQDTLEWIDYRTVNSNIPSNNILALKTDSKNNVWLITASSGLAKFVNGNFITYNSNNSLLPSDFTTCLAIDPQDNIWVGTNKGLVKFDGINWTVYNTSNSSLPDDYIASLYCTPDSKLWIGTPNGLVTMANGNFTVYNMSNSAIYSDKVASIVMDNGGKLWVACAEAISTFYNGQWKSYTRLEDGLIGYSANCLAVDKNGIIYASFPANKKRGVEGGVMKFEDNIWQSVVINGIPFGSINCIFFDNSGGKWFGSYDGTLYMKPDGTNIIYAGSKNAMFSNNAMDITTDLKNNIWFAFMGGGIVKYKR